MEEPYRTYVEQRSDSVASVLTDIVGDTNVQLCPRAITPEEQVFDDPGAIVYGAVVRTIADGYKSILYYPNRSFDDYSGMVAKSPGEAMTYASLQFKKGNKVRLKDPIESDGAGQTTASNPDEVYDFYSLNPRFLETGLVIMPNLSEINDRISIGKIALSDFGSFLYFGREFSIEHEGRPVYGGSEIGLYREGDYKSEITVTKEFGISDTLRVLGRYALKDYEQVTLNLGRASVDVISGFTDNGDPYADAVDVTPRVGGVTPAEVLAIRELIGEHRDVVYSRSSLYFGDNTRDISGQLFVNTPTLKITGEIM